MPQKPIDYDAIARQHGGAVAVVDYDAIAREVQQTAPVQPQGQSTHPLARLGNTVVDVGTGALKGAANTVIGLGELFHKVPGIRQISDAVAGGNADASYGAARAQVQPTNTAQKIGYAGEQIGEYFIPAGAAEKTAATIAAKLPALTNAPRMVQSAARLAPRMATEAAAAGSVTAAQGGNPITGAAMGAAGPVIGKGIEAAAPRLAEAAQKQVMQALGPTKERYKAIAERLAPKMLQRGIRGSREGMVEQASKALEVAGDQIDTALQQFGARQVGTQPLLDAIESAKDAFRTTVQKPMGAVTAAGQTGRVLNVGPNGLASVVVEFEPRAIKQLDKLKTVIADLGTDARVDQLVAVRRAWDKVVADAGGFSHRAGGAIGTPLKDTTEAWAKREATGAIRKLLDQEVPELTALNKEYSFWKNLDDVLTQTMKRTQPQGPGLTREIAGAAGAAAGASHGIGGAVALQKVGKMANALFTSPRWRMASAHLKDSLAKAIADNDVNKIATAIARINAGGTSQVTRPSISR